MTHHRLKPTTILLLSLSLVFVLTTLSLTLLTISRLASKPRPELVDLGVSKTTFTGALPSKLPPEEQIPLDQIATLKSMMPLQTRDFAIFFDYGDYVFDVTFSPTGTQTSFSRWLSDSDLDKIPSTKFRLHNP